MLKWREAKWWTKWEENSNLFLEGFVLSWLYNVFCYVLSLCDYPCIYPIIVLQYFYTMKLIYLFWFRLLKTKNTMQWKEDLMYTVISWANLWPYWISLVETIIPFWWYFSPLDGFLDFCMKKFLNWWINKMLMNKKDLEIIQLFIWIRGGNWWISWIENA